MARLYQGSDWRFGIARSRMLAMVWSAEAQHAQMQRQKLAYAMALRKPIRLLVLDGTRLPEDLCTGYADVQVARVSSARAAGQQIREWLEGLPEPPRQPHSAGGAPWPALDGLRRRSANGPKEDCLFCNSFQRICLHQRQLLNSSLHYSKGSRLCSMRGKSKIRVPSKHSILSRLCCANMTLQAPSVW
jgi:hypothetical protein